MGDRYHEMAIALEAQVDTETSARAPCSTICSYNSIGSTRDQSAFSLNSDDSQQTVAAKNEHNAALAAATANVRNVHSASVHSAHALEDEYNEARGYQRPIHALPLDVPRANINAAHEQRRNGSAVFARDNRC